MKSSLSRNSTRHPAVIDTLGGAPLPSSAGGPPKPPRSAKAPKPAKSPTGPKAPRPQKDENSGNSHVLRYVAGALVVVSLLGWFLIRTFAGTEAPAPTLAADSSSEPTSAPALAVTPPVETTEPVADPSACRTDTGDQKSGAGVIAAFEHAYYVARSGAAVRALATPETSLPLADKIQAGIDTVPTGTTHCVRITPITTGVYSVVLAEMRPGQAPAQFPQTITTKDIDGRWFVDTIS